MKRGGQWMILLLCILGMQASYAKDGVWYKSTSLDQEFETITKSHDRTITMIIRFSDEIGDLSSKTDKVLAKKQNLEKKIDNELAVLSKLSSTPDRKFIDSIVLCFGKLKSTIQKEYNNAILLRMGMKFTYTQVSSFVFALEDADKEIIQIEKLLYVLEKNYATQNNLQYTKELENLKSNILQNENVLKYHDKVFLIFYNLYEKENLILRTPKTNSDTLSKIRQSFALDLVNAEDSLKKIGGYENDLNFNAAICNYIKYLKGQYFEYMDFYSTYMTAIQLKKHPNQNKSQIDNNTQYIREMKTAEARLQENYKNLFSHRGEVLFSIEEASFEFLYAHCPAFH